MNSENNIINKLHGKIFLTGKIQILTGLHIGTSGDFSAIGAVDNIVIRDSISNKPIIPGSSLKGKMRFLLARTLFSDNSLEMKKIKEEDNIIKRLFGSSNPIFLSRLQFHDSFLNDNSAEKLEKYDLDLPYSEIKYENTIDRATSIANPRQQERVPAGAEFDFKITYNIENKDELAEDIDKLSTCMELLQDDYLGGHGTRGYGRIKFIDIGINFKKYNQDLDINIDELKEKIESKVK